MDAPAIFEKQTEIKLLHPASTEEVTDSGLNLRIVQDLSACVMLSLSGTVKA
jgi:hypothetical protein